MKKGLEDSLDPPEELIKQAMNRLSLKDKSVKIYDPSTHDTITSYVEKLKVFGFDNVEIETSNDTTEMYLDFKNKHCKAQTYYFQIRKCENALCKYHGPRRAVAQITEFPDPVSYDDDGVMRYKEGIDKDEKHLPSKMSTLQKQIITSLSPQLHRLLRMLVYC